MQTKQDVAVVTLAIDHYPRAQSHALQSLRGALSRCKEVERLLVLEGPLVIPVVRCVRERPSMVGRRFQKIWSSSPSGTPSRATARALITFSPRAAIGPPTGPKPFAPFSSVKDSDEPSIATYTSRSSPLCARATVAAKTLSASAAG